MIDLRPGSGTQDLSCDILPLDLENPSHSPYHGFSYMWDDQHTLNMDDNAEHQIQTEELLCQNGIYVKISKNLNNFLRRVRHPGRSTPLWIDQISVNQADEVEKAQQVKIMQHVYRKAHATLLWIGEEDQYTELGLQFAKDPYQVLGKAPRSTVASLAPFHDPAFSEMTGLPACPSPEREALAMLYKREVFQRVWVIQELALATNIEMMCGSHAMNFLHFVEVARIVIDKSWYRLLLDVYGSDCRPYFPAILYNRFRAVHNSERESLQLLLVSTRRFQATHPVDKIYGLTGLSQVNLADVLAPALLPDYTKPVEEVYTDVTFHVIDLEGSLEILSTVEDRTTRKLW